MPLFPCTKWLVDLSFASGRQFTSCARHTFYVGRKKTFLSNNLFYKIDFLNLKLCFRIHLTKRRDKTAEAEFVDLLKLFWYRVIDSLAPITCNCSTIFPYKKEPGVEFIPITCHLLSTATIKINKKCLFDVILYIANCLFRKFEVVDFASPILMNNVLSLLHILWNLWNTFFLNLVGSQGLWEKWSSARGLFEWLLYSAIKNSPNSGVAGVYSNLFYNSSFSSFCDS